MRKKCNMFESSPNHPPPPSMEKFSSMNLVPGAKRLGTTAEESSALGQSKYLVQTQLRSRHVHTAVPNLFLHKPRTSCFIHHCGIITNNFLLTYLSDSVIIEEDEGMAPNHKERGWTFEKNQDSHAFNRRER